MNEALPPRPPRARNETRDLTTPIRIALNRLPGVRVVRNTDRGVMVPLRAIHQPNPPKILTGLGEGGADLVGIVRLSIQCFWPGAGGAYVLRDETIGRAFALEVKWPDYEKRANAETRRRLKLQRMWRKAFRDLGGFACIVFSVDDALRAVERCRAGEGE